MCQTASNACVSASLSRKREEEEEEEIKKEADRIPFFASQNGKIPVGEQVLVWVENENRVRTRLMCISL